MSLLVEVQRTVVLPSCMPSKSATTQTRPPRIRRCPEADARSPRPPDDPVSYRRLLNGEERLRRETLSKACDSAFMMHAPILPHESDRLSALQQYELIGSDVDLSLDTIITLARNLFQVPIATVSLVAEEKQVFFGAQGLEVCETGRDVSFCAHALGQARSIRRFRCPARSALRGQPTGHRRAAHPLLRRRSASVTGRSRYRHAVHHRPSAQDRVLGSRQGDTAHAVDACAGEA